MAMRTNAPGAKGQSGSRRRPAGPSSVSNGWELKDPTQNVLDALDAAVQRIDDLSSIREYALREIVDEKNRRLDDIMVLRSDYEEKLREAEAKRIDAIRLVDVNAVSIANERAVAQANVLQTQVAASAEAVRALVATTASAFAAQLNQSLNQVTDRLSSLEKAQYERKGSSDVSDPAMLLRLDAMSAKIEGLSGTTKQGVGNALAWIGGGAGFILTLVLIIGGIYAITHH